MWELATYLILTQNGISPQEKNITNFVKQLRIIYIIRTKFGIICNM